MKLPFFRSEATAKRPGTLRIHGVVLLGCCSLTLSPQALGQAEALSDVGLDPATEARPVASATGDTEGSANILVYCTGKATSQGCVPFLDSVGTPSMSDTNPFTVRGNDFMPANGGVLIYGYGKASLNFHGGKLCVKMPIRMTGKKKIDTLKGAIKCVTGSKVPITGRLTINFNAHIQSGVDPFLTSGQKTFAQWYQRDPANTIGGFPDALSDGMRFTIEP